MRRSVDGGSRANLVGMGCLLAPRRASLAEATLAGWPTHTRHHSQASDRRRTSRLLPPARTRRSGARTTTSAVPKPLPLNPPFHSGTPRCMKGRAAWPQADAGARGTPLVADFRGTRPGAPASRPARLPSATTDDQAEGRWHALLSLIAIGSVGFALWTSGALARHWSEITAAVQRLVGIS